MTNPRFNLDTMSGVFPGTRTAIYQRVRVKPLGDQESASGAGTTWAQLLWHEEPPLCSVQMQASADGGAEQGETLLIPDPLREDFFDRLQQALQEKGWRVQTCGNCRHWQAVAHRTSKEFVGGVCGVGAATFLGRLVEQTTFGDVPFTEGATAEEFPLQLHLQSILSVDCTHWQAQNQSDVEKADQNRPFPRLALMAALPKIAEVSESKLKFWPRLLRRWRRQLKLGAPARLPEAWRSQLLERSGVGAGTEPCFACQGRIANLGALAVETPDRDKQTFSIWRCRTCHTLYLNDWIDRWERLETLETEETIYRIAPIEAAALLDLFESVRGGEHPGQRRDRYAQRQAILDWLSDRSPLSRQVRFGR